MPTVTIPHRHLNLAYDESGAGTPVLLIHALPLDRAMWTPQLDHLTDDFRVLAPDLPEFGESGDLFEGYTIDVLADSMADFLDGVGVGSRVVVVGVSTGADIALALARRQPQRLSGLVLANPLTSSESDARGSEWERLFDLVRGDLTDATAEEALRFLVGGPGRAVRSGVRSLIRRSAARQSAAAAIRAAYAMQERPDPGPFLGRITVPTLVLSGEDDALSPGDQVCAFAERIGSADYLEIPHAGHFSNLDNPTAFNSALRFFLRNLSGSAVATFPRTSTRVDSPVPEIPLSHVAH